MKNLKIVQLPLEYKMIAITNHAQKRLKERYNISNFNKIKRLAVKTFLKGAEPNEKFLKSQRNLKLFGFGTYIYKQRENDIFVYQNNGRDVVLITVYQLYAKLV